MRPSRAHAIAIACLAAVVMATPACSSDDDASTTTTSDATATSTTQAIPSTTAPSGPGHSIAAVDFRYFTYELSPGTEDDDPETVTVVDGSYTSDEGLDSLYFEVTDVDYADLDGDGEDEAAVSIYYETGGTGRFSDVEIFRWSPTDGDAVRVTSDGIGDRGDGGLVDVAVDANNAVGAALLVQRNVDSEGACCPTVIEERALRLGGDQLVTVGTPRKWGIVRLGMDPENTEPVKVKFIAGADRAKLEGDATEPVSATLEANAGQQLSLVFDELDDPEQYVTVRVNAPSGEEVATIGPAKPWTGTFPLPVTGIYTIDVEANGKVDPSIGAYFGVTVIIG